MGLPDSAVIARAAELMEAELGALKLDKSNVEGMLPTAYSSGRFAVFL